MNLNLLMSALRARFGLFALIVLLSVLATAVVSMLMPKTYVSTVSLLVDSRDEQSMSSSMIPVRERTGFMQTQLDLIGSMKVARKVVQDMRLTENAEIREAFENDTEGRGSMEDWIAGGLLKALKTDVSQSSVVQISFSSENAAFSTDAANAFARAYVATVLELRTEPARQTARWFDEQLTGLRATLETAQDRLAAYQRDKGIIGTDERTDFEGTRLTELSGALARAQEQSSDATTRQQLAREFLARGGSADRLPEVAANPFIQSLRADLVRGESRLQEMSTQLGPAHPSYQRQVSENQAMRARLDAEMKKVVDGLGNAARQGQQREAELRNAMAAQRARMLEMRSSRSELGVLMRDVENAQRAYDNARQRFTSSDIESRARQTNVTVLNPAIEPINPARPKLGLNIALAAVMGIMLGLATVFLLETMDRRVRSLSDLKEGGLNLPVLGELNARPANRLAAPAYRALPKPV